MARTDTLPHFLTDVADAIRTKGGTSETIQASTFDTAITNLPSGGDFNDYIDTSNVNGTSSNTWWQYKLPSTKMSEVEIVVGGSTNNTFPNYMFYNCKWLYLPKLKTTKKEATYGLSFSNTFNGCSRVTSLDLSELDIAPATITNMFKNCSALAHLDIRKFDFSKVSSKTDAFSGIPAGCEIIVASSTEKDWLNTNFPDLTNVKTVAEYENQ